MRYRTTSIGTQLPDRWVLPDALRDDTGIIFASAFPGYDTSPTSSSATTSTARGARAGDALQALRARAARRRAGRAPSSTSASPSCERRWRPSRTRSTAGSSSASCRWATPSSPRSSAPAGPNTQVNAACASTTQALALAEDWIRAGRCRRVIVIAADDVTSDT